MGDKLKTPPLLEALCEFRFSSESPWDWTIPGRLFGVLEKDFPKKAEKRNPQVEVTFSPQERVGRVISAPTRIEKLQFRSEDERKLVQVGENLLAINFLAPYSDWEDFLGTIKSVFKCYISVVPTYCIERIGLRYINKLEPQVNEETPDIEKYFSWAAPIENLLNQPVSKFYQRYEVSYMAPPGRLFIHSGTASFDQTGDTSLVLDLDFSSEIAGGEMAVDRIADWLDDAHGRIEEAFIAFLNKDYYERLKTGI